MATSGCRFGRVVTLTGERVVPVHVISGTADVCSHKEHAMKEQDLDLIADGAGLLTSATFLLLTLNVIAWQRMRIGAMSLREVLKSVGIGILFVGCLAVFETRSSGSLLAGVQLAMLSSIRGRSGESSILLFSCVASLSESRHWCDHSASTTA